MKKTLISICVATILSCGTTQVNSSPLPTIDGFYKWFCGEKIYTNLTNNVGDPFHPYKRTPGLETEKQVIETLAPFYGFSKEDTWGLITFSGTDATAYGLYFGSKLLEHQTGKKPIVYLSDSAHYTHLRLADAQRLEVRLVASNSDGSMNAQDLDRVLDDDRPALMVYSMGTTFKGGIDNQRKLNDILAKHPSIKVYRHVDSALFGGYLPYTRYAYLVDRNYQGYDSIAVSSHKFFGLDEPAGLFLTTDTILQAQKFPRDPKLNDNMPTLNGSRSPITPLKFKWLVDNLGPKVWSKQGNDMLANAQYLYDALRSKRYPCWLTEGSNTVYFKKPQNEIVERYSLGTYSDEILGELANIQVMPKISREQLEELANSIK